jgi:hypothetical protein
MHCPGTPTHPSARAETRRGWCPRSCHALAICRISAISVSMQHPVLSHLSLCLTTELRTRKDATAAIVASAGTSLLSLAPNIPSTDARANPRIPTDASPYTHDVLQVHGAPDVRRVRRVRPRQPHTARRGEKYLSRGWLCCSLLNGRVQRQLNGGGVGSGSVSPCTSHSLRSARRSQPKRGSPWTSTLASLGTSNSSSPSA